MEAATNDKAEKISDAVRIVVFMFVLYPVLGRTWTIARPSNEPNQAEFVPRDRLIVNNLLRNGRDTIGNEKALCLFAFVLALEGSFGYTTHAISAEVGSVALCGWLK